jgi:hypothetical protein
VHQVKNRGMRLYSGRDYRPLPRHGSQAKNKTNGTFPSLGRTDADSIIGQLCMHANSVVYAHTDSSHGVGR